MTDTVRSTGGGARPLRLAPFRALRYSLEQVPDLGAVTCPPYDVIGESGVHGWERAHPYNVVRLILPRGDDGSDRYAHAAYDLRSWIDAGILVRDDRPALYVYEQDTPNGIALGLVGAVSLHDPSERRILPHEDVFPGPVADRAALMATTRAQFEPILLTYEGGGPASDAVDATVDTQPMLETATTDGATHRLWQINDPPTLARIAADIATRQALIADGHHRYAAYLSLRPGQASGLAMLVDARRHPLRLGSIHRSVAGLPLDSAVDAARIGFAEVTEVGGGADIVAALAGAGRVGPAFAVGDGDRWVLLSAPEAGVVAAGMPGSHSRTWTGLDASIAGEFLLTTCWQLTDADDRVAYHHHADGAVERARRRGGVALLLNPAALEDVLELAARGERMPRKSTSFGPKPRTGLLMRSLAN